MKLHTLLVLHLICAVTDAVRLAPYPVKSPCTSQQTNVRQEWGTLSVSQRKSYIDAVFCMQNKPSIIPDGEVPGAKSRFDDFVAVHANYTMHVHLNGLFLSWHRHFVYLWEQALREECAYEGYQPYWNWALWCEDLAGSPLFDDSETSLSGDGEYVDYGGYTIGGANLPHGTGGGCITGGPFQNMTVNLGPFDFDLVFAGGLPSNWTSYTPHCLQRDLNNYVATLYGNQTAVDYLLAQPDIVSFQDTMSKLNPIATDIGVHPGGHVSIGYGLFDFFVSPGDPAFFLHHGMIDRVWTIWQAVDPESRLVALNGTTDIFDPPGAEEVTLGTVQSWGILGETRQTKELMNVRAGVYCYTYE